MLSVPVGLTSWLWHNKFQPLEPPPPPHLKIMDPPMKIVLKYRKLYLCAENCTRVQKIVLVCRKLYSCAENVTRVQKIVLEYKYEYCNSAWGPIHWALFLWVDLESMTESDIFSMPCEVPSELAAQVYQNYNFDHSYNTDLPITEYNEQVRTIVNYS